MAATDRITIPVLAAMAVTCHAGGAAAQDVAAAEALFDRGVEEMKAGRYEKGCPALAESYRIDPRPGALFTLAECENKRGKIATAVARYEEYLRLVATLAPAQIERQRERIDIANKQKASLQSEVPRLTITLAEGAPANTVVTRDGSVVGAAVLGVAIPVDPGEHVLTTEAPGGKRREKRITIERKEHREIELHVDAPIGSEAAEPKASKPTAVSKEDASKPAGLGGQRIAALAVGGAGVASLLVGTITGIVTLTTKSTVTANCDGPACNQEGFDAAQRAKALGNASTATFVIGGALVTAGVVLYLTAPRTPTKQTGLRLGIAPRHDGALLIARGVW
jgi:hypothetical protein